jgi:hypothetical protein
MVDSYMQMSRNAEIRAEYSGRTYERRVHARARVRMGLRPPVGGVARADRRLSGPHLA